jgi:metal-responsive CopG/Arc/MetJ family transcriptional regulator
MAKPPKKPKTEESSVVLAFRLPKDLVAQIDVIAEKEMRQRANMVYVLLTEALQTRAAEK